ncbi:succinate dehydrogenase, cytochrome b556 subunit [Novosphingobium sp. TH158]|uniref:succinate dehydrogenase, cytochrome b556 subunit n=1 Tax=Novosphingobium sp. TH158 TaxID=2067455 RepID=UPI000C7D3DC1|nr:succinate dehydrogenase, cytochrome b556 subunit [Novosphingobium sp. TH158]PLK25524.1 succinate dehydrogenase, cytochrome b556 subunit [Novosphingobium sp. TH158]
MAKASKRPTSPHLQIWRWGPGMALSILHRITGVGLGLFGLGLLLWWLGALASGPDAYATFADWAWADLSTLSWSGGAIIASIVKVLIKVVMIGLTWAFFQHLVSGLRHFVLDTGAGYELDANNRWASMSIVLGPLLTALFWALLLFV